MRSSTTRSNWRLPRGWANRRGRGAYADLGTAYKSLGDLDKAIEYHTQRLAIATEVGDRAGEGRAYANLGNTYQSLGDFSLAIEYHTQDLAIAKEVGDRAREGGAYCNLGMCHMHVGEYVKVVAFYERSHAMSTKIGIGHMQTKAALLSYVWASR